MSAPEYVPTAPTAKRHYSSPPQRRRSWSATRPGDVVGTAPAPVSALGAQGPDQGYAMTLTRIFDTKLSLMYGEDRDDVDSGCVAVALKRSSLLGRAPVVHDLRVAYTLFGYLDASPKPDLVEWRKELFSEVHHPAHYFERRHIVDSVPDDVLLQTPDEVTLRYYDDWRQQLYL